MLDSAVKPVADQLFLEIVRENMREVYETLEERAADEEKEMIGGMLEADKLGIDRMVEAAMTNMWKNMEMKS